MTELGFTLWLLLGLQATGAQETSFDPPIYSLDKADEFTIDWYSIDGGGTTSSGGVFELSGTLGQPDAVRSTGGDFDLLGGFQAVFTVFPLNTCGATNTILCDNFEEGLMSWAVFP